MHFTESDKSGFSINLSLELPGAFYTTIERKADGVDYKSESYDKVVDTIIPKVVKTKYKANELKNLVKSKKEIDRNIIEKQFDVIDARNFERFRGEAIEQRAGLRSGNIKNSICIPYNQLININKTFKTKKEISEIFDKNLKNINSDSVVFSCGSGVTACVLALAYSLISDKYLPKIYDGSWAEYGKI